MEQKKFGKDFLMVLAGQIISLFGNAVIRFALPLHLLNVTGSAALYGSITGIAFLPLIVMTPIGGMIADRINKRNIMVGLDFFTAALITVFLLLYGKMDLVALVFVMLFLLYGISGAYQPAVQSSIPLLVKRESVMSANAWINMVSSLSGLLGPALGGVVYHTWGIMPVMAVCMICFVVSAVMEIFIHIPYVKQAEKTGLWSTVRSDWKESITYITKTKPELGKMTICCGVINLFLSSLIMVGIPVIITQRFQFAGNNNSEMYGFMQAILAVGGLAGGILAGICSDRLKIQSSWKFLLTAALSLCPMGMALLLVKSDEIAYIILGICGFAVMCCASLYTIQTMSCIQTETPPELVGKVVAWVIALATCAQPVGQILYGVVFEIMTGAEAWIFLITGAVSAGCAVYSRTFLPAADLQRADSGKSAPDTGECK